MDYLTLILYKGRLYKMNNTGPSAEPCRTPWLSLNMQDSLARCTIQTDMGLLLHD